MKCTAPVVANFWKQFEITEFIERKLRQDHLRTTKTNEVCHFSVIVRWDRNATALNLCRDIYAVSEIRARITSRRRLYNRQPLAIRLATCIPLTSAYRRTHSIWCTRHRHWQSSNHQMADNPINWWISNRPKH